MTGRLCCSVAEAHDLVVGSACPPVSDSSDQEGADLRFLVEKDICLD
jgi:hypothetical protein